LIFRDRAELMSFQNSWWNCSS